MIPRSSNHIVLVGRLKIPLGNALVSPPFRSLVSSLSPDKGKGDLRSVWQRGARRVKDTESREQNFGPYYQRIRETHDPTLHLKTLEDELKSTIGQALRKQAEKILQAQALMEREYETWLRLMRQIQADAGVTEREPGDAEAPRQAKALLRESAQRHNQYRAQAVQARWELIVHRQAAGFLVNNHNVVYQTFPIGEALSVNDSSSSRTDGSSREGAISATSAPGSGKRGHDASASRIPDQLDWWQRVGRWR